MLACILPLNEMVHRCTTAEIKFLFDDKIRFYVFLTAMADELPYVQPLNVSEGAQTAVNRLWGYNGFCFDSLQLSVVWPSNIIIISFLT